MAKKKLQTEWESVEPLKKGDLFIDNTGEVSPKDTGTILRVVRIVNESPQSHKVVYERAKIIRFEKFQLPKKSKKH